MGILASAWQHFRAAVGGIDTVLKVWKWIKVLLFPVIAYAGLQQYHINERLTESVRDLSEAAHAITAPPVVHRPPPAPPPPDQKGYIDQAIKNHIERGH